MSAVYRARHVRTNRTVAVKVLSAALATDEEYRTRFLEEAQRASRVDEPHIIDVYDADEQENRLYLAMRFVEGGDLSTLLKREGPLPPDRALAIMAQVASALDAAHAEGLIHRDVKPGNILMGPHGHVYLSDFGVAKATAGRALTQTGMFVGSPDYAAPEQWEGQRTIDGRADQYALAGVLHECLTGARPYERDSITGLMYAHLQLPPPRVSETHPGLPAGLDDVVARAMAKDRDHRYATCGEFVAAARDALDVGDATLLAPPVSAPTQASGPPTVAAPPAEPPSTPTRLATPQPAPPPPPPPAQTPPTMPVPAPAPGRSRRNAYIVAGIVAGALIIAGVVTGVILATRGGNESASGETGTTAAQTTTSPTTTAATTTTTGGSASFSKPSSLFRAIDRGDARATFADGAYVFEIDVANRPLVAVTNRDAPLDVRARVDAQLIRGNGYGAAILCRYQSPRDYYLLAIASGQRYNIVKYTAGKPRSLVGGFQTSTLIRPGRAKNTLEAECTGQGTVVLNLIVDGTQIGTAADADSPHTGGKVGLRVGSDEPNVRVRFTNFVTSEA